MTVAKPSLHYPDGFESLLSAPNFTPSEMAGAAFKLQWDKP